MRRTRRCYHWGEAPDCKPENLARGETWGARIQRRRPTRSLAAEVPIAEADDREHLEEDLATL
jgi:hypothetical protein